MPLEKDLAAGKPWAFDAAVAERFDEMLDRSIPLHDVMRDAVAELGATFVVPKTDVVDLGCSRGAALAPLVKRFGAYNRFVGLDVSGPMLEAARERFKGYISTGIVRIDEFDLRTGYPAVAASLTMAVLTLQFVPIEHRQRLVQDVYDRTLEGGGFIVVEKVLGETAKLDKRFVERYYALKAANGYSQDEIDRKRLALEGILVPMTARWNVDLLQQAGFRQVDCFYRWMNFAGWVAVK